MPNDRHPLVEIEHLSKSYCRGSQVIPVLEDITFSIAPGETLALAGESGSARTPFASASSATAKVPTRLSKARATARPPRNTSNSSESVMGSPTCTSFCASLRFAAPISKNRSWRRRGLF